MPTARPGVTTVKKVNYNLIRELEQEQVKPGRPQFRSGDTLRVHLKVREGNRERIQLFEGVVIRHQKGLLSERFTLRRVAHGFGVERIFLVHSPLIDKIEVLRLGKVRRARLYYLRSRVGARATRIKERKRV